MMAQLPYCDLGMTTAVLMISESNVVFATIVMESRYDDNRSPTLQHTVEIVDMLYAWTQRATASSSWLCIWTEKSTPNSHQET